MTTDPTTDAGPAAVPGDVFRFEGERRPLGWAALLAHPYEVDWLYVVPADREPFVGSADVAVAGPGEPPLVLRCGLGIWLTRDQLRAGRRLPALAGGDLARAMDKLADVARAQAVGSPEEQAVDQRPEYEELLDELESVGNRLKHDLWSRLL